MKLEDAWVVWSHEHDAWWGPDHRGYDRRLFSAGIYTEAEAMEIQRNANFAPGVHNETALPLKIALSGRLINLCPPGTVAALLLDVRQSALRRTVPSSGENGHNPQPTTNSAPETEGAVG